MTAFSDFLEVQILDEIFNNVAFAAPQTFVALYTTATADDGTGTEVIGGSYARIEVFPNSGIAPKWNLAVPDITGHAVDNLDAITFVTATANWGDISHVAIRDALTAGNLLYHGQLTATVTINSGSQFSFPVGDLNLRTE